MQVEPVGGPLCLVLPIDTLQPCQPFWGNTLCMGSAVGGAAGSGVAVREGFGLLTGGSAFMAAAAFLAATVALSRRLRVFRSSSDDWLMIFTGVAGAPAPAAGSGRCVVPPIDSMAFTSHV